MEGWDRSLYIGAVSLLVRLHAAMGSSVEPALYKRRDFDQNSDPLARLAADFNAQGFDLIMEENGETWAIVDRPEPAAAPLPAEGEPEARTGFKSKRLKPSSLAPLTIEVGSPAPTSPTSSQEASLMDAPFCLKCSRPLILSAAAVPSGSGPAWTCLPCELTFTKEQLATFKPGEWAVGRDLFTEYLSSNEYRLGAVWEPADRLGLLYHLELACRVLEGSVPAESVDIEGLTGYIRARAGMAREALYRAGLLPEEG